MFRRRRPGKTSLGDAHLGDARPSDAELGEARPGVTEPGDAEPGIVAKAENFGWRHATRIRPALSNVSVTIRRGERILITGDSGAGKSTLLAALAGVLGDEEEGDAEGSLVTRGTVGLVLQDPESQVIASRVGDDVAFGCENMRIPRQEIWPRVTRALELVGLDVPLNHPTSRLSGGQKQRLALAGVIAMGADLILLDEPTANLDPEGQRGIVAAVAKVAEATGAALVIVEHRPQRWADVVDRYYRLGEEGLAEISREDLPTPPGPPELPRARAVSAAQSQAILEADALQTRFGPPRTLSVPAGASTVLTGRNGAGKSTLALTLVGLLPARGGEVTYADALRQGLSGPPSTWTSRQLAERIGYVFQDPEHQFVARTVEEEMHVGLGERHPERIEELLATLRLEHLRKANPFTLSGGEKRRLSVATALVAAPALLILDEPTFGQDDRTFIELVRLIRELTDRGTTVVSITHDPAYIAALGDHQVVIE